MISDKTFDCRLLVVIINYKTPGLVCDAILSLENEISVGTDRVVVVDNLSADNSIEIMNQFVQDKGFESWLDIVDSGRNGGFSAGNNVGLNHFRAEYYLLLNSDAYVHEGAISALIEKADTDPGVGLVGPKLEWPDGRHQVSLFNHLTPLNSFLSAAKTGLFTKLFGGFGVKEVAIPLGLHDDDGAEWLSFACVLIKGGVVDSIGLMDEGYFMYREDNDYCRRASQSGWKLAYEPAARVVHLNQGASNDFGVKRLPTFYFKSRSRYFIKYYGRLGLFTANVLWLLGRAISIIRELVQAKIPAFHRSMPKDIWLGFFDKVSES